jgi:transglutaminase-like putative cysteine protease
MVLQVLIPTGRHGTTEVLAHMARLVRESAREPAVRQMALDLVRSVYASRYADVVWGLKNFFMRHFRFIDEPDEMITAPSRLLRAIREAGAAWGDCDDAAVLAAAMLYSLGFAVRFRAVIEQPDGSFGHVFAEYKAPDSQVWLIFDPTVPYRPQYESSLLQEI